MNKRNFLKTLGIGAAVGTFASIYGIPTILKSSKLIIPASSRIDENGMFNIFTKEEIAEHWKLAPHPCFVYNDKAYVNRTSRLPQMVHECEYKSVLSGNKTILDSMQYYSKRHIDRYKLTHCYCVCINTSPIIYPDYSKHYSIFVRGARVV